MAKHGSLFKNMNFVANDPLKRNKPINVCSLNLNIISNYIFFHQTFVNINNIINIDNIIIHGKIIWTSV